MISKANILKAMLSKDFQDMVEQAEPKRLVQTRESNRRSMFLTRPVSHEMNTKTNININKKGSKFSLQIQPHRNRPDQEKFVTRQNWRNLMRWQGFDDYMFLRDPKQLRNIRGRDTLSRNDIVEPLTVTNIIHVSQFSADDNIQEYKDQHRRMQVQEIKKLYQPGEANFQKFNPNNYKKSFLFSEDKITLAQNDKLDELITKSLKILTLINERMISEEIFAISPLGERLLRLLWKIGCLNLFMMGCYIHNLILQVYGKEKIAYTNWKKTLRICNMQGSINHKFKLVSYKHIAKICIKIQQYDKSIIYLKKMLKLAWIVNDTNYELFTYDKISLCYYYKQDINKAIFYHEKFAQGEFEPHESGMRAVGEQAYLLGAKLKEGLMDQHSYSEDDYDLDALLQKGNLSKWETENRRKELKQMIKKLPMEYKKGHSFGKINRSNNESGADFKNQMIILNRFTVKNQTPLGPIFQKEVETQGQRIKKKSEQARSCQYLFNQKSTNRVAQNFLLQEEIKDQGQNDLFCFKPSENVLFIKKMIRVFQYDLKYYAEHKSLFGNSTDELL